MVWEKAKKVTKTIGIAGQTVEVSSADELRDEIMRIADSHGYARYIVKAGGNEISAEEIQEAFDNGEEIILEKVDKAA